MKVRVLLCEADSCCYDFAGKKKKKKKMERGFGVKDI